MLSQLGADPPKTLMPPTQDNPRGYWESDALMSFHERLLASAASSWKDFQTLDPAWLKGPAAVAFATELASLIEKEFCGACHMLVKDPRICRLLPFWLKQLNAMHIEPRITIVIRNPLEVAASLHQRDRLSTTTSLLLWLRHMLDSEAATRHLRRSLVPYEFLLTDWRTAAQRLVRELGLDLSLSSEDAGKRVDAFLTPELRHYRSSDDELLARRDVLDLIKGAYAALCQIARGGRATRALRSLDDVRRKFDNACQVLGPLIVEAEKERALAAGHVEAVKQEVAERDRLVAEAVTRANQAETKLADQTGKTAAAIKRAESAEAKASEQSRNAEQAKKEAAELTHAHQAAHHSLTKTAEVLAHVIREQETLRGSTPWRILLALRALDEKMPTSIGRMARYVVGKAWRLTAPWLHRDRRAQPAMGAIIDMEWYLKRYPDVALSGTDPLAHYIAFGASEGRDPGPGFSTHGYLENNPDVEAQGLNPLLHYLTFGWDEGRDVSEGFSPESRYQEWIRSRERLHLAKKGTHLAQRPKISILMPTYNTAEDVLIHAIESVRAQTYENWELCIADDASTTPHVRVILLRYQESDPRIKTVFREVNGGISAASNSALELATGEWLAMLDHDDVLPPHALFSVAAAINSNPGVELMYSDEDKLNAIGRRYEPYFKPDFSPELFRSQNYLGHLSVHRTHNVRSVGGWRIGFEGSQDYDLNLRIVERIDPKTIHHIPEVLYHWRAIRGSTALARKEKPYAHAAGLRALREHIERLALPARAEEIPGIPYYRTRFSVSHPHPLVSIIMPTRDRADLLRTCVASILDRTVYEPFELMIVDNDSVEQETAALLAKLAKDRRVRVLSYPHPFNYSAINNFAARAAQGEILALLNNDIEVISEDWLTEMAAWATQPDIGCVGAKLYYPNNRVQHAGVILGLGGVAGHAHKFFPRDHGGHFGRLKVAQNYSAVTGACLVVRKEIYDAVGGLDEENLIVAFNDVDFCLKVRQMGYRNVWTPFAELYHHESVSRGREDTPYKHERFTKEIRFMVQKWGRQLENDPYHSPHLTKTRGDFSIGLQ
jgi:glycosyltransferase involved in cell wall biosynthesis